MIVVLRNAVAEVSGDCLAVESEYGWWRLCASGRRAVLELELSDVEVPLDVNVPTHPNVALEVLASVAVSMTEGGWSHGPPLRIAVVGPRASGKSTLVGRLLRLPTAAGPTERPEVHRVIVLGREAEVVDMPGGAPAPPADCTVVVVPLDVYEEPPRVGGRLSLIHI